MSDGLTRAADEAERLALDWAHNLDTGTDPAQRDLILIGLPRLARRWGVPVELDRERVFERLIEIESLDLPPGTPAVPTPNVTAGRVAGVTIGSTPGYPGWDSVDGMHMEWIGDGDPAARDAFEWQLAAWWEAVFTTARSHLQSIDPFLLA